MAILLAFPLFILLLMLQTVAISQLPLLYGTADLLLVVLVAWGLQERVTSAWAWAIIAGLMVSFVSALPLLTPLLGYLAVTGITRLMHRRIWHSPILAMMLITILGTMVYHSISILAIQFWEIPLPWRESLSLVVLPSTLLNFALSIPVFALVKDVANWVYPVEVE